MPVPLSSPSLRQFSLAKLSYFLISLSILTYVLIVGKDILFPLVFSVLLAFMLKPVCDFFERYLPRIPAATLTLLSAFIPFALAGMFFTIQLSKVVKELPDIARGLTESVEEITADVGAIFKLNRRAANRWLSDNLAKAVEEPLYLISSSLSSTTSVLLNFTLIVIYTFLFLLYRTSFKRFLLQQFGKRAREEGSLLLYDLQQVAKKYFSGIITVALILGVLNSIGLYFIGLDFPILWGFLAATLAIIPYVGTILGGLLPFLYSFAAGDGYWQPIAIVILYSFIQALEGNFITPKVVGRSVNINPLVAIVALFVGQAIWGLVGMVVALPLLAIVRIVLDHVSTFRPFALLLSDQFYDESERYMTEFDHSHFRLVNIFSVSFREPLAETAPEVSLPKPATSPNPQSE